MIESQQQQQQQQHWQFHIGVQGNNHAQGRKQASPDYVAALMATQIVVVAQRDEWEDHYRLLEGMVAGAMVLTDTVLGLPAGLVHGESVILYTSAQDLRDKIHYYLDPAHAWERLAIAKQGRRIAMSRHRSWHHMEEIVFGRPLTMCSNIDQADDQKRLGRTGSQCPYVVNADEMHQDCPPMAARETAIEG
jgi:hypothetical protein